MSAEETTHQQLSESAPEPNRPQRFAWLTKLSELNIVDTCACLTLCLLILHGDKQWYIYTPASCLFIGGLALPGLRKNDTFWFAVALFLGVGLVANWYAADNHKYLAFYWSIALFVTSSAHYSQKILATHARWLLGLCMAFAVAWKVYSPDYMTGEFFLETLAFDKRFTDITWLLGGYDGVMLEFNLKAMKELYATGGDSAPFDIMHFEGFGFLIAFITWWGLVLEAIIAVLFLIPKTWKLSKYKDASLVLFILTTYAIAPVPGFGLLLIIMGLAQTPKTAVWTRAAYLFTFGMLQIYKTPWSKYLIGWTSLPYQ